MNIAIITNGILPVPSVKGGGVETLIQQFIDTNEKKGIFNIDIYSIYDEDAYQKSTLYGYSKFIFLNKIINEKKTVNCLKWRLFKIPSLPKQYNIKKIVDQVNNKKYDAIIFENTFTQIKPISKIYDGKIYLHIHNDIINNDGSYWYKKELKSIIDKCYKLITVSQFIKNRILEIGNIDQNKIVVLKNCTDTERFKIKLSNSEIRTIKNRYNISDEDIVINFVGRLVPEKGVKELIKAFTMIKTTKKVKLIIVGDTNLCDEENSYIKELYEISNIMKDNIVYTGYIPYEETHLIRSISNISVVPSIWNEPGALVVIESLASGLPLVITNSGGMPEYIDDSCCIVINNDKDIVKNLSQQLTYIIENDKLREKMAIESKNYSNQFSIENYYYNFAKIILEKEIEK